MLIHQLLLWENKHKFNLILWALLPLSSSLSIVAICTSIALHFTWNAAALSWAALCNWFMMKPREDKIFNILKSYNNRFPNEEMCFPHDDMHYWSSLCFPNCLWNYICLNGVEVADRQWWWWWWWWWVHGSHLLIVNSLLSLIARLTHPHQP